MVSALRYGTSATIEVEVAPEQLLAACGEPRGSALADPAAAIVAELAAPLEFPPLTQAMIPGDRVVLALEHGVPQAAALAGAIVRMLLDAGAAASDICILQARIDPDCTAADLRGQLSKEARDQVEILIHDPKGREGLSYLAADEDGEPIYINRRLFDADVVLPIGCMRLESSIGYYGVNATLYPAFSDQPTLERFQAAGVLDSVDESTRRRKKADEVAWLLGVLMTVQVIPADEGGVLHVVAGAPVAVGERARALCEAAWECEIPRRAELVVAAIGGSAGQQTWENVGRALASAARAVAENGAIALCTELADQPGPALKWIGRARDLPAAMKHIRRQHSTDATAAHELAQALQHVQVYLLSRLDESVTEKLGVGHIAAPAEIARLASRHRSCILLANAQYALPTAAEEATEAAAETAE
jgi:nickel-dependent lactate racemase